MKKRFPKNLQGLTAQEIFEGRYRGVSLDFGNLWASHRYTDFSPDEVCLDSFLTPNTPLKMPWVSSPMSTVTMARMAGRMADNGGFGIIHNMLDSLQQRREIGKVKFGVVINPLVFDPDTPLDHLEIFRREYSHIPITEDRRPNAKLLGMITKSFRLRPHYRTIKDCLADESVKSPASILRREILYENGVVNREKALAVMEEKKAEALAVVEENNSLFGLIIARDLKLSSSASAHATLDANGRRRVGAALTTFEEDYENRVPLIIESGVDVLCFDTSHGHSRFIARAMDWTKKNYPKVDLIAGNVSTVDGAKFLVDHGADAIRAGNGSGEACLTHEVTNTGASSAVGLYRVATALRGSKVKVIADGGIKNSGHMFIALALGADTVMTGTYLAPLQESAAPLEIVIENGKEVLRKMHWGMASETAMRERVSARYGAEKIRMPEGKKIPLVPEQHPLAEFAAQTMAGVRQAFAYVGVRSIPELHEKVQSGDITFDVSL